MLIKPFLRVSLILFFAAGISTYAVTSLFLMPRYESTAVIFTPNTHANIHLVNAGMRFGYDKEIGEQLEILRSNAVRDALVKEFDLINVYKIDTAVEFWQEKLQRKYEHNISLDRTINKSIEIIVRDENPQQAAVMANRLVSLADEHKSTVVKRNIEQAATAARSSYREKEAVISRMTDSLETLRQAGESIWTYGEERKSSRYQNYELQYRRELDRYLDLKQRWEELDDLLKTDVPRSYVVSTAIPSSKPIYPRKGLLSLFAGLLAAIGYLVVRNAQFS